MAFTKIVSPGIDTTGSYTVQELNTVGVVTAGTVQVGAATTVHTTGIDLGSGNITSHNINSTGIISATSFVGPVTGNITGDITATSGTFSGNVSIGGTLTYEDVTNIDSVGLITARSGINVTGNILGTQDQTFIGANTSDGSDNKSVMLGGGGSTSISRGAYVWVKGNEYSGSGGELILAGGGVSSSLIDFYTNSGPRARITSTGELNIGGSYTQTTNKLNVTGTAYVSSDITAGDDIIAADEIRNNVPSDFWASDNTFISLNGYGNLTHQGGYQTVLTSNGYRTSTSAQWKSYAANSTTGAAQIRLDPTGYISFGTESNKSNGSSWVVTERLRIDSSGLVGINNASPATVLDIKSTKNGDGLTVTKGSNVSAFLGHNGSGDEGLLLLKDGGATKVLLYAETNQNSYFNSGGDIIFGHNTSVTGAYDNSAQTKQVQIVNGANDGNQGLGIYSYSSAGWAPRIELATSRSSSKGGHTVVTDGQSCGLMVFNGSDGTDFSTVAMIGANVSGTPANNSIPGSLSFYTSPGSGLVERLNITQAGNVILGYAGNSLHFQNGFNNSTARIQNGGGSNSSELKFLVRNAGAESERLRIASTGQLNVNQANNSNLQGQVTIFEGTDFNSASQGGRDNIYLISDRTSGNGQYGSSIAWSRVQYADRRAAAIVNVQTSSDEDQVGLAFFTHPGSTASDDIVEKLRITHDGQFETNGVRNIYQSFQLVNNTTYNWDFTVPSEGGYGNSFYLVAGYNHYYTTSYGAHRTCWFSSRGTSVNSMGNGIEQYHSQSGNWTFSKPNSTTVRITKTGGTYGGAGYGFFHLMYNHF